MNAEDKSAWIDHKNAFVAYLDILGFKETVKNTDKQEIQSLFDLVADATSKATGKTYHKIYPKEKIQYRVMSDAIVLFIPYNERCPWKEGMKAFRFIVSAVQTLQFNLAKNDCWLRGGLSCGGISFTKKNLFGTGMVHAYDSEQKAKYPRALLDTKKVLEAFDKMEASDEQSVPNSCDDLLKETNRKFNNPRYTHEFLRSVNRKHGSDEDNCVFVNYLYWLMNSYEDAKDEKNREKILPLVRNNIETATNSDVALKYAWVEEYMLDLDIELQRTPCFF